MRLRLLPVLMFALAGTVTIKVGAVWDAIEVSVGSESQAQAQPQPSPTAPSNQSPAPATPAVSSTAASAQSSASQSSAQGQQAGTQGQAGASAPLSPPASAGASAPAPQQQAATAPTVPDGVQPPVAPDAAAADAARKEEPVPDPFDYTDEEVDVLQQLAKRREELDVRARQLDEREALVQAAEQRMEQKMAELKALQATVEALLQKRSDEQEAELKSLVKTYENMKPKAAAKVFEEMDMDVLLDVVERMNERKVAPILALVTPTRAKEITFELAQRRQLPVPQ